jgi:hypothetical protein
LLRLLLLLLLLLQVPVSMLNTCGALQRMRTSAAS